MVTNDRWGNDTTCRHGGYFTCQDRYNPGKLQDRKWENAMTIDGGSWGFRQNADLSSYLSIEDLIQVNFRVLRNYSFQLVLNISTEPTLYPQIISANSRLWETFHAVSARFI